MDEREIERAISFGWEGSSGADSIPTIERVYSQTDSGAYECVYPGCGFVRKDSHAMWRHVHSAHGEPSLPPADFDPGPWL